MQLIPVWLAFAALQVAVRLKDDPELAERLRQRDPKVMSALYDRYGRLVYSLIQRVVRDTGVAEDLTQETFLRVWNRAQAFDAQRGSLGPWIITVARNRAIDYLRSSDGRMASRSIELADLDHPARFADIDDKALSMDRARRLKEAFEKLTPNQKTVLELAYYEGLSQTEMAERMQQPLGTVKTWVRAALKAMRDQLGEAAAAT
ncbi:MAG: sigma-70 family RNA polymerase sigma factor [Acidobacteriota bacterium]